MAELGAYEPIYWATLRTLNAKGATMAAGDVPMATGAEALGAVVSNGFSFRNMLRNGAMAVAQRGVTITSPASDNYTMDGWDWFNLVGAGAVTITQQSTVVPDSTFASAMKIDVTTADTVVDAGDQYAIVQKIEGLNFARAGFGGAAAKAIVLSFWLRIDSASLTFPATLTGAVSNNARNRAWPFEVTVAASATWTKCTVNITGDITGTWLQTNGIGLNLYLNLMIGATYQAAAGAWTGSDRRGTANQSNIMGNTANDMYLTGVQLEVGATATPYEYKPYGLELIENQRYLQVFDASLAAGYVVGTGTTLSATVAEIFLPLPVQMRAIPALTVTAAEWAVSDTVTATTLTAMAIAGGSNNSVVQLGCTVAAGLTGFRALELLEDATDNGKLILSAEL